MPGRLDYEDEPTAKRMNIQIYINLFLGSWYVINISFGSAIFISFISPPFAFQPFSFHHALSCFPKRFSLLSQTKINNTMKNIMKWIKAKKYLYIHNIYASCMHDAGVYLPKKLLHNVVIANFSNVVFWIIVPSKIFRIVISSYQSVFYLFIS